VSQHAGLEPDRWAAFGRDRQLLMIANEMHRASRLVEPGDDERRRNAYARVLQLTDLTVVANVHRALRRELLRWRDLVASLYLREAPDPAAHREALYALLRLSPEASRQIPHIAPRR
jgi:hypothetical protein